MIHHHAVISGKRLYVEPDQWCARCAYPALSFWCFYFHLVIIRYKACRTAHGQCLDGSIFRQRFLALVGTVSPLYADCDHGMD